ncbi:hypothetical protein [uncultured Thiodictyon sp.]|nr:hypothetical protein [uncultured Thiodictyon sp.]
MRTRQELPDVLTDRASLSLSWSDYSITTTTTTAYLGSRLPHQF